MATRHAIVRTDNLSGTTDGSKLISAKFTAAPIRLLLTTEMLYLFQTSL